MMNKIFITTGITLLVVLALFAAGCSKGGLQPSQTYQSPAQAVQTLPQSSPSANSSTTMIQSGLPLTVFQPSDGATLMTDTVIVVGKTAPGVVVDVNDQTGTADAKGNFSISVSLDSGLNAIDVIATDNNGNQGEIVLLENVEALAVGAGTMKLK
jgi:ABC-type glycerol-3-phosphate transport system substrate-binding protein